MCKVFGNKCVVLTDPYNALYPTRYPAPPSSQVYTQSPSKRPTQNPVSSPSLPPITDSCNFEGREVMKLVMHPHQRTSSNTGDLCFYLFE